MLTLFKKIFGKTEPKPVAAPVAVVPRASPTSSSMPSIEVAHLSLAAITRRFPEELKPLLNHEPAADATVALPLPTILKQLASGSVKMSLATLQRQAHGLIKPLAPGDKRMVDVPLAEIFRHVRPETLRRRSDQRASATPDIGFNLFGDASKPFAISPDDHLQEVPNIPDALDPTPAPAPTGPRVLRMDPTFHERLGTAPAPAATPAAPEVRDEATPEVNGWAASIEPPIQPQRVVAPPPSFELPKAVPAPAPLLAPVTIPAPAPIPVHHAAPILKPEGPTLPLKLSSLSGGWPPEIRAEIERFDPETLVTLPVDEVTKGLAKGRVSFTWGHIHAWLEPEPAEPTAIPPAIALQLPLKIVAPAFLSASKKPKAERKTLDFDAEIPALFNGAQPPPPAPAPVAETAPEALPDAPPAAEALPAPIEAGAVAVLEEPAPPGPPETVGEIFGLPEKRHWTPAELVAGTVKLSGVAGAIVALQEGLQVSSVLPDGVKSEVVAAFLPQIFARLNQYAGEMRLGDVDDLLFTTHGAHCQIYRLGYVYLAILGKRGESLPWHELRIISEELARQTHK